MDNHFTAKYKTLNPAQRQAVDALEGPVMVVAGPGTGKTEVLALRIANILTQTDTPPNGILALTFTRSGVSAMRGRLESYIGSDARDVTINTFHSFAASIVEKYYEVLDFDYVPKLIDENDSVFLIDEILNSSDWQYIKSRSNNAQYFSDLKSLVSLLKKERISPDEFKTLIEIEVKELENDPENISSRGESKGALKQEILKKISSFKRSLEAVKFYQIYEDLKKERNLMDYDDVLEYAVRIVTMSTSAQSDIREEYLYVLVDEHQDSSYVQNLFLKAVWQEVELPNIFVVGDDRQLIYGFSGANINYFEEFSHIFGKAKLITLVENYRSTSNILDLADELLASSITQDKLKTNTKVKNTINLFEYNFPRDEVIGAALKIKELIYSGESPEDFAILVPKNRHVRAVQQILLDMDLPVVGEKGISFFGLSEVSDFVNIINIINDPFNSVGICNSLVSNISRLNTYNAHKFIKNFKKPDILTIDDLINSGNTDSLFAAESEVVKWGKLLKKYTENLKNEKISRIVSTIGNELLIDQVENHDELLKNVEIVRTFIHLAESFEEKNPKGKIAEFLEYLTRLEQYNAHIEIASIGRSKGVSTMTLHRSKGLEYKYVFILHMNQEVLMSSKKNAFTLPQKIKELTEKKDIQTAKRELYVAITRAKEHCYITYSKQSLTGGDLGLAHIIEDLDKKHFVVKNNLDTEKEIIDANISNFALKPNNNKSPSTIENVLDFVSERFTETRISVSMLNNFFECPWKWYFRNFLKLPEVKSSSLTLGTAVHAALEFILKEKSLPSDIDIESKLRDIFIKEGIIDTADLKPLLRDAMYATKSWVDNYYKILAKDHISERDISFRDPEFPNLQMYGKIDLTERFPSGEIVVTDFKTGKSKTKNEIEKLDKENRLSVYMRQLVMYSYLIRGAEKGKIVTSSRLLFLEADIKDKNALYTTSVTDEQIDLLIRDIKDYQTGLENKEWAKRPCHAVSYGREGSDCEYCARANKIFES